MIDKNGNLTIIKGGTLDDLVTYYEPDGVTPVNLTGMGAITRIKENHKSDNVIILSTANGGMILGGTAGTVRWFMDKEDTANITINEGIFDTFLINNDIEEPFLFKKNFYAAERV